MKVGDAAELRQAAQTLDILDLPLAAAFLYMSVDCLRIKARMGEVPGASKMGRAWVFVKADLLAWVRKSSPTKQEGGDVFLSESCTATGISTFDHTVDKEYEKLLGLSQQQKTNRLPKNTTTKSRASCGHA